MVDQLTLWDEPRDGLRWSLSRHSRLRECARRTYHHDIQARGGSRPDASRESHTAFVLRRLRTRYSWVGEVVHELIELCLGAIRRGENVSPEALVERGTRRMRAQYAESVQRLYWDRPMAFGLFEHEYGTDISRQEWRDQRDRMEACVRRFFELPLVAVIRGTPTYRWLSLEGLGSFELDGASIVVRPDFAFRDGDGRVVLVDWKTGQARPEAERLQLSIYGLFAKQAWGLGPGDVLGKVAHLGDHEGERVSDFVLTAADLDATYTLIRASVAEHRDILAKPTDAASLEQFFPRTEDVSRCHFCPFKRLCGR